MKKVCLFLYLLLVTYGSAFSSELKNMVLKLAKEQTVSDLLFQNGVPNLYDKDEKIGNVRKVLFLNRLSYKKARKLEAGTKLIIPRELEKFFLIKKEKVEALKEE
ncbi:MAG: hypothetical protein ACI9QD_000699 [Thermoproteota archaeon]|jgi:hypothetical protein